MNVLRISSSGSLLQVARQTGPSALRALIVATVTRWNARAVAKSSPANEAVEVGACWSLAAATSPAGREIRVRRDAHPVKKAWRHTNWLSRGLKEVSNTDTVLVQCPRHRHRASHSVRVDSSLPCRSPRWSETPLLGLGALDAIHSTIEFHLRLVMPARSIAVAERRQLKFQTCYESNLELTTSNYVISFSRRF